MPKKHSITCGKTIWRGRIDVVLWTDVVCVRKCSRDACGGKRMRVRVGEGLYFNSEGVGWWLRKHKKEVFQIKSNWLGKN